MYMRHKSFLYMTIHLRFQHRFTFDEQAGKTGSPRLMTQRLHGHSCLLQRTSKHILQLIYNIYSGREFLKKGLTYGTRTCSLTVGGGHKQKCQSDEQCVRFVLMGKVASIQWFWFLIMDVHTEISSSVESIHLTFSP